MGHREQIFEVPIVTKSIWRAQENCELYKPLKRLQREAPHSRVSAIKTRGMPSPPTLHSHLKSQIRQKVSLSFKHHTGYGILVIAASSLEIARPLRSDVRAYIRDCSLEQNRKITYLSSRDLYKLYLLAATPVYR